MKLRYLYRAFRARYRDQRQEIAACLDAVRPGATVADIGAHKGSYLYWLRRAAADTGRVFAFEPQARLARYLEAIVASFGWKNVTVSAAAVADTPGRAHLHIPGSGDSPGASLARAPGGAGQVCECEVVTLDDVLAGAARVRLLKVDVEGFELEVFRGAQRILRAHRPTLVFECEARHLTRHRMTDVFAFLQDLGYAGRFFALDGLRPLDQFDVAQHQRSEGDRFWDRREYRNNFLFAPATARA
jgi:FkbM family methyltransferase